jgi:dihydropteroate synthase
MAGQSAPKILGVLNLSPESMVEESIAVGPEAIRDRAALLARTGADWIDLGGRSITPDVPMIDDDEEQRRLGPALDLLKPPGSERFHYRVSVDTWSPETGRFGLEHGADGVNYTGGAPPRAHHDPV